MDIYHIWCSLKDGVRDLEFVQAARAYLDHLKRNQRIAGYRITRRKLGLGPPALPEFHIMLEFEDLAQLDRAFHQVSVRADPVEGLHQAVNSKVSHVTFALYRDFPDPHREVGQERF